MPLPPKPGNKKTVPGIAFHILPTFSNPLESKYYKNIEVQIHILVALM
jgi:hypothetical protein